MLLTFSHQELPEPGAAPYGAIWPERVPVSVYNNFIFIPYKLYNLTNPDSWQLSDNFSVQWWL
jgi:hypothetical protein